MKGKRKPRFIVNVDYWSNGDLSTIRYTCTGILSVIISLLSLVYERNLKIESISILRVGNEKD